VRLVVQVTLFGLIAGSFYALMGVAWNVIYHTTRTFHFAHGIVFVGAAYTAALLTPRTGLLVAGVVAILIAVLLGAAIEWILYRRMRRRGASLFVILIASLGVTILLQNVIILLFSGRLRELRGFPVESLSLAGLSFTTLHVLTVGVSITVIGVLYLILSRTKRGKAIRAVAGNAMMAEVVGISRERVYVLAFALGSAVAAVAAILWSLERGVLPTTYVTPLFAGFVVSIVGGIGSMKGAVLAGLLLGLAENLSQVVWAPEWAHLVSFVILILILILRPTGLFGSEVEKLV
jgi:branched-chain amino acid transport system permease protein